MKSVVVDGYFGMNNIGDDGYCVVASHFAREAWHAERLFFITDRLPSLCGPGKALLPIRGLLPGHRRFAPIPRLVQIRNLIHLGGSRFSRMNTRRRDQLFLARLRLVSLQALGVSVGPFRCDKDARDVASFLSNFSTITLRDTVSRARLDDLGIRENVYQGFDIGVLLPDVPLVADAIARHRKGKGARRRLGVSICNYEVLGQGDPRNEEVRRERLLRLLRRLSESSDVSFRFLVFNSHARLGEERLLQSYAQELSSHAPTEVVQYSGDVRGTLRALANCDAVLGMRLHSAVFAYALGVPFAMVAYHPKCLDFAAEVGLPDHLVLPSVGPEEYEHAADIISTLLFEPRPQDQPRLPLAVAKHLARQTLELDNGAHNAAGRV